MLYQNTVPLDLHGSMLFDVGGCPHNHLALSPFETSPHVGDSDHISNHVLKDVGSLLFLDIKNYNYLSSNIGLKKYGNV